MWVLNLCMTPPFGSLLSLSLGVCCPCHEKSFNGAIPFEVHLNAQAVAGPFELLPKSVYIWYHYGDIFAV